MEKVKFSIITTTYNRMKSGYLDQCIKSIRAQKKGNYDYEHIIVNDGSSDETAEYLKKQSQKDSRLVVVNKKNEGTAKGWQSGIKKVSGDFVTFLDDDDMLTRDSLAKRARYIIENPEIDWFVGDALYVDEKNKKIPNIFQTRFWKKNMYERLLLINTIHSGTPVVRTSKLGEVVWPKWLERSQDYFLWLELARPERGLKMGHLIEPVVKYRSHSANYTSNLGSGDKRKAKKALNNRIRRLHPESLAFLAVRGADLEAQSWKIDDYDNFKKYYQDLREYVDNLEKARIVKLIKFTRRAYRKFLRIIIKNVS